MSNHGPAAADTSIKTPGSAEPSSPLAACQTVAPGFPDASQQQLQSLVAEFEEHRESWELLRQQEQSRLRQEGDTLSEAWLRLEDEQRRLLAERERLRSGAPPSVSQVRAASTQAGSASGAPGHAGNRPPTKSDRRTPTNSTAWWQLEQLRLEIQKHARREA